MAGGVRWDLSGKCEFERNEKRCDRVPESVLENEDTNRCGTSVREHIIMAMTRGDLVHINRKRKAVKA